MPTLDAIVEPLCACGGLSMMHLGLMARTCRWETPYVKDAQRHRVGEVMRRHLPNAALAQRLEQNFDVTHTHYNIPRGPTPYWRVWVDGKLKTLPVIMDDLLSIDGDEARLASLFAALRQNRLPSTSAFAMSLALPGTSTPTPCEPHSDRGLASCAAGYRCCAVWFTGAGGVPRNPHRAGAQRRRHFEHTSTLNRAC